MPTKASAPAVEAKPKSVRSAAKHEKPVKKPRKVKAADSQAAKLCPPVRRYVLDTNVLLHDPTAIFRFEEHDVYLPLVVLEELDRHKKGTEDIARNARTVMRLLDQLLPEGSMANGFCLRKGSNDLASGKLYFRSADDLQQDGKVATAGLESEKADNQILACAMHLLKTLDNTILVTKDINLRVKAMACDIPAQDYRNDKVTASDSDVLPTGFQYIDAAFWLKYQTQSDASAYWHKDARQYTRVDLSLPVNSFLVEALADDDSRLWRVESSGVDESVIYTIQAPSGKKKPFVEARNNEQAMAVDLLHDPDIDFVALLGPAGTGKTLLAVAAGLEQVRENTYGDVLITRATVPMGEDIGFLPGNEQEKMGAWLGGTMNDVFEVCGLTDLKSPLRQKVQIASMTFMRGRSFHNRFIVIDEAQNLTIRQMRALLTRAGEGCKVILTGNLGQIDSPYLDEGSSGLAWAVKKLQNWQHGGHLILTQGERSRLATYVEEVAERDDFAD